MLDGLSDWWNDVELWVIRLPFPFQFMVVMAVLLPVCVGLAWVIDRGIDRVTAESSPVADPAEPDQRPGS